MIERQASTGAQPSRARRATRSLAQRVLLGSLITALGLSVAFGVFEVVIWRLPVDSYTFVARGADGRVSEHVVSHDAHVASALRQKINSLLDDPSVVFFGPQCNEPIYTGPDTSYFYDFLIGDRSIETVWATRTDCGEAWVNCGGVTLMVGNGATPMPITARPRAASREMSHSSIGAESSFRLQARDLRPVTALVDQQRALEAYDHHAVLVETGRAHADDAHLWTRARGARLQHLGA